MGARRCDGSGALWSPNTFCVGGPSREGGGAEGKGGRTARNQTGHDRRECVLAFSHDVLKANCLPHAPPQGCIRREGTSEAVPAAVRSAVGGGCQSGWAVTVGYKKYKLALAVRETVHGHRLGALEEGGGGGATSPPSNAPPPPPSNPLPSPHATHPIVWAKVVAPQPSLRPQSLMPVHCRDRP